MSNYARKPYIRDVFQAELIQGAEWTEPDGYPVIESWMIPKVPPKELYQWDRRYDVKNPLIAGMSYYCTDPGFIPVLNNPQGYVEKLRKYACVVGIDPSPYDNMPLCVQKSQIFNNLAITYYYGSQGIKVVPNVRLGNDKTIGMLTAIPQHTLIAVGTNGFVENKETHKIYANQMKIVVDNLVPAGIMVYGPAPKDIFDYAIMHGIPIYQYDSYIMKKNKEDRNRKGREKSEREQ